MWRIFHRRITNCIEQTSTTTFHRHYCKPHPPQNNLILVQQLTEVLKHKQWKNILKSTNLRKNLNPHVVRSVLHQHQLSNNLERLLSFFHWSRYKVGIQSDLNIHSFLAVLFCSNNLYSHTSTILELVIGFGLPPSDVLKSIDNSRKEFDDSRKFDHVIYSLLMDKYREKGYLFEAASVVFAHKELDYVPSLFYCNRLLIDLLNANNLRLFWQVSNAMREANVTFNALVYTSMIDAHCREGNLSEAKEVLAEMEEKGHCPLHNFLMTALFRANRVDEAIELKNCMLSKSKVPNIYFYTTVINGLCAANRFSEVMMVLDEMTEMGVKPDTVVYDSLLNCFLKQDDVDLALCNTLLRGLCECAKMDKAQELVVEMTGKGIEPDLTTCTLLIEGYCQGGNASAALELLEEMKKKNLTPVESTCCLITDCLSGNIDLHMVMSSLQALVRKNGKQNAHSWRTLLMVCFRKGNLEWLRMILEAMHEHGVMPATPHYNVVIEGLCRAQEMKTARACLAEMLDRGLKPDLYTYEAFIIGYCGTGELHYADRYLVQMLRHGFKPTTAIYSALMSVNCKRGKISEALGIFRGMLALGGSEVRDVYLLLLDGLLVNGKMQEAAHVISELHNKDLVADVSSYEVLIRYYAKCGEIEKAVSLYEKTQSSGICPNLRTHHHLINGLFRAGENERAKMIFDIILKEGLRPDKATYTAMISGLAKGGQLSEAFGLFDSMIIRGLSPDGIIYNALSDGCCMTGNLQKAQGLLQEMLQKKIASTEAFNTLIQRFLKNGNVLEAKQLLKTMVEGCVTPDQNTYTVLVEQLCKDGMMEEAQVLIQKCKKSV